MPNPNFAYIAEDRVRSRLCVAKFSSASDLTITDFSEGGNSPDASRLSLRGLVVIASNSERLVNLLVSEGFIGFDPNINNRFTLKNIVGIVLGGLFILLIVIGLFLPAETAA